VQHEQASEKAVVACETPHHGRALLLSF